MHPPRSITEDFVLACGRRRRQNRRVVDASDRAVAGTGETEAARWGRTRARGLAAVCLIALATALASPPVKGQYLYPVFPTRYIVHEPMIADPVLSSHEVSSVAAFNGIHIFTTGQVGPMTSRFDAATRRWGGWQAVGTQASTSPGSHPDLWGVSLPAAADEGEGVAIHGFQRYVEEPRNEAAIGVASLSGVAPPTNLWWDDTAPVTVDSAYDMVPACALSAGHGKGVRMYGMNLSRLELLRLERAPGSNVWRRVALGIHQSSPYELRRHKLGPQAAVVANGYDVVFAKKSTSDGDAVVFHNGTRWELLDGPVAGEDDFSDAPLAFVETHGETRITVVVVAREDHTNDDFRVYSRSWTGSGRPAASGWGPWQDHGRHPQVPQGAKFRLTSAIVWSDNGGTPRVNLFGVTEPIGGEKRLVEFWSWNRTNAHLVAGQLRALDVSDDGIAQDIEVVSSGAYVRSGSYYRLSVFVRATSGRVYEYYWHTYGGWYWSDLTPPSIKDLISPRTLIPGGF